MNTQCSAARLESALAGTLPTEDENSLHRHLRECAECSAALEQMAGGPAWCREAAALLAGDELDPAVPACDQWSEADFTVEYLEPADDPSVLGRLGGLGGYDVLEIIGSGGMGIVLKGFERELKRCVAIKVLAPHLAQSSLAKKRFAREAQAAAAVVHPNVMAIHQVQPNGRLPFLVMPLVAGESLAQRLASRGVLELKEILRIGMQAAAGLAAAHEQGLVHRDVKPANLLLERGVERAVLTDFGLACAADDVSLTRYGIIAGTPQYMSPEQAKGEAVDGRSDLFSLGCVLYEMASGVSPFRADSTMATLRRLIDEPPRALASLNPELPPWFVAIVDRLLEKDPSRRFRSAKEVSELLEGCLAHVQQPANVPLPAGAPVVKPIAPATRPAPRWSKRRRFGTIAAILLFLLGGFAAVQALTDEPSDISGEWTSDGEGWGKVVLRKTGPREYAGTFTDTTGKEPGKIELKWSRIERRFNGKWSEGDDRFGKLSVRSVGGEIRGAWTTSREARINPGTPELADLVWVRAKAAAQGKDTPSGIGKTPAEVNWEFGPVIDRTLLCLGSDPDSPDPRRQWANGNALRLGDGMTFYLPTKSASGKSDLDLSPEELVKWHDEKKVNLVFDYRAETDQWELKLRNVRIAELAKIPLDSLKSFREWKSPSAKELQERFSKLEWRKTATADTDPKGKGFQSLLLARGEQPWAWRGAGASGMTFAFETSDGRRGILQFTQSNYGKSPVTRPAGKGYRDVSIRYKLIQPADAPAKSDAPSGIGKKPPEASWEFGPVRTRTLICPGGHRSGPRVIPSNGEALRLDDGKLFTLPMKPVSGKDGKEGKDDMGADISREGLAKWFGESKVNLVIDFRAQTDQWELKLRNVRLADIASDPDYDKEFQKTISANDLQERFAKLEWRKTADAGLSDPKWKGFQSLLLTRGEQPGRMFAFETADGRRGILQFTGATISGSKDGPRRAANAHIRYKLLQRADAPATKDAPSGTGNKPPEVSGGFGSVIRRTLFCPSSPHRSGSALRFEDGIAFDLQTKSASGKGDISAEELVNWYDETKVNLVIDYRAETDQWELKQRNVRIADIAGDPADASDEWKTISANELRERFPKFEWRKTVNADTVLKEKGFQSLLLPCGEKPGRTFAFETSDGRRGIFQFVATKEAMLGGKLYHREASIRYKLLLPMETPAKPEGGAGASIKLNLGPELVRTLACPPSSQNPMRKLPNRSALRLEDGKLFPLPAKSAPGKGDLDDFSPEELAKWCDETKVNLLVDYRTETDQWELKLRHVKFADVASVPSNDVNDWKTISANKLQERLAKLEWRKTAPANTDPKGKGFQSLLLKRGEQPGTFAFETSDGHQGIFQFVGMNKRAAGYGDALIRFKLLQSAEKPEGDGGASIKLNFGPIVRPRGMLSYIWAPDNLNGSALRLEDGRLFPLPAKSALGKGDPGDHSPDELAKWCEKTKVNLVIDYRTGTDQWELKLRNVRFADVASTRSNSVEDWKTLTADELQERFSKLEWRKTTNAETDPKGKGFQSLLLLRGEPPWGMMFAFETSDGPRGILQVTGSQRSSRGDREVHLRYKLLQPADVPAKPGGG